MRLSKHLLTLVGSIALLNLVTGCSSVMCGSHQAISINSRPLGADVLIYNSDCQVVYRKTTPCVADLPRSDGAGKPGHYVILIKKQGFTPVQVPLTGKPNDAYYASILAGGVGSLVDNATGAKWTLTPEVVETDAVPHSYSVFQQEDVMVVLKPRTTEEPHHGLAEYKPDQQK
jgi:hypothetical protein